MFQTLHGVQIPYISTHGLTCFKRLLRPAVQSNSCSHSLSSIGDVSPCLAPNKVHFFISADVHVNLVHSMQNDSRNIATYSSTEAALEACKRTAPQGLRLHQCQRFTEPRLCLPPGVTGLRTACNSGARYGDIAAAFENDSCAAAAAAAASGGGVTIVVVGGAGWGTEGDVDSDVALERVLGGDWGWERCMGRCWGGAVSSSTVLFMGSAAGAVRVAVEVAGGCFMSCRCASLCICGRLGGAEGGVLDGGC